MDKNIDLNSFSKDNSKNLINSQDFNSNEINNINNNEYSSNNIIQDPQEVLRTYIEGKHYFLKN